MTSSEIRKRFLQFFEKRGHAVLLSASLVPKNDPSVLFNTAGMQPLVPYLLGEPHPAGTKLVNVQKCVRTQDIDEVGDNTHDTFFEMLGNWSLGDYFKKEAITWSYEFLTSKEEGLGLDPKRLYVTVFEGDENAPRDEESYEIWKSIFEANGVSGERIYFMSAKSNWWSVGENGPCGPDTEMFYDVTGTLTNGLTKEEYTQADNEQKVVEIWNDVFMEYEKKDGVVIGKLKNKNVDTGSGLERITMAVQGKDNIFDTDLFSDIIAYIKENASSYNETSVRIIADHFRTALFLTSDGVLPSNKDQGYILRRLIRRAVVRAQKIGFAIEKIPNILTIYSTQYKDTYPDIALPANVDAIMTEVQKFQKTLEAGIKEFEKGTDPFILATTYGFPIEVTIEMAQQLNKTVDVESFWEQMKAHQAASRAGAEQKFKGGLANTGEQTVKLHTAHHLLLAALQHVISPSIHQRGSNITDERLRMDFNFDRKLTEEEKHAVETWVNTAITKGYSVIKKEMPKDEAERMGAEMEFGTKYPDTVSVYVIQDENGESISKEFCGGPHVTNTNMLGTFRIIKEEAVSSGVRRIKATLEK
jgi:alanyl-tRNA synthetase